MTNRNTPAMTVSDFEHLLEVYGADRTRWPIASRASAAACLTSNSAARQLLSEAEALDAVLLRSDEYGTDLGVLTDRIVAAAQSSPHLATRSGVSTAVSAKVKSAASATTSPLVGSAWRQAAALLAASLVIGVFAGQTQLGARAVPALQDLTGLATSHSTEQLALLDLHIESVDED